MIKLMFVFLGVTLGMFMMCKRNMQAIAVDAEKANCRIVFYNVENLFDYSDDPETNDKDFLPDGKMRWTQAIYEKKQQNIAKVIKALGTNENQLPELIALSEIENRRVLEDLIEKMNPSKSYKIVHRDSPDERGIDVALLYDSNKIEVLSSDFHTVELKGDHTREILEAKVKIGGEPIHLFVNHWSSNFPSKKESEYKRLAAANVLNNAVDKIQAKDKDAKIVIVGDFNDQPSDKSITQVLAADKVGVASAELYNLSSPWQNSPNNGTVYLSFKKTWLTIDQIMVSPALVDQHKGWQTTPQQAHIFNEDWLTYERDGKKIPSRYISSKGKVYGGYSDHFPIYLDLVK